MSIKEGNRSIIESLQSMNKKMDENLQSLKEDNRLFREKLRREREQREQSNPKIDDKQMEVEQVPEDKNIEQASPEPKDSGEKKIQIIQDKEEVKIEERRTVRPRKARITKELIEMTRSGLINICLLYTSRCV